MNLVAISSVLAGGAGSGCKGPNCGRPSKSEWKGLMDEHNAIKNNRIRTSDQFDRIYKMQKIRLPALADSIEQKYGKLLQQKPSGAARSFTAHINWSRQQLDAADRAYAKGKEEEATQLQDDALSQLHSVITDLKETFHEDKQSKIADVKRLFRE